MVLKEEKPMVISLPTRYSHPGGIDTRPIITRAYSNRGVPICIIYVIVEQIDSRTIWIGYGVNRITCVVCLRGGSPQHRGTYREAEKQQRDDECE